MRAWEILTEHDDRYPPSKPLTLRALHKIKHEQRQREKNEARRRRLLPIMYGQDDQREIEIAKRDLDNDRREIALDKREAELDLLNQQIQQSEKSHDHIKNMAKRWISKNDG
jgi:hypothetical protein